MPTGKTFSLAEVARHAAKNDLCIVYDSKVYNVTPFINEHPGGEDIILQLGGKDATEEFDDVGHSDEAKEQLRELLIGALDSASSATTTALRSSKTAQQQGPSSTLIYGLIGTAGAVAFGVYRYLYVG